MSRKKCVLPAKFSRSRLNNLYYLLLCLFVFSSAQGQENPWKGLNSENPWKTNETNPSDTIQRTSLIAPKDSTNQTEQTRIQDSVSLEAHEKNSIVLSFENGLFYHIDRESTNYLKSIKDLSYMNFEAGGTFAGCFASSLFLNVFSIPINTIAICYPGKREKRALKQFETNNPTATNEEREMVKKGIRKTKVENGMAGMLSGLLCSSLAWFTIFK